MAGSRDGVLSSLVAVTGAVSCCNLVKPFLIQDRLSYQTVRFISLRKGKKKTHLQFFFVFWASWNASSFLPKHWTQRGWVKKRLAPLLGWEELRGWSPWLQGAAELVGFLLVNQAHCANHLEKSDTRIICSKTRIKNTSVTQFISPSLFQSQHVLLQIAWMFTHSMCVCLNLRRLSAGKCLLSLPMVKLPILQGSAQTHLLLYEDFLLDVSQVLAPSLSN